MLDFYIKASTLILNPSGWDWTAISGTITLFALVTTWYLFFHGKRSQQSLFYLTQIKSYYAETTALLNATDNNNVNWHHAIESLKMADNLVSQLKDKSHKNICVMDMMSTGFRIINVIKDIDDFRFFYGVPDYKTKDSALLFQQTNPQSFETPTFRIAPTALSCLCTFIDKVNRIFHDSELNTSYHQIFKKDYFKFSIRNPKTSGFSEITMKVVIEYMNDFAKHKRARTQHHLAEH